MKVSRFWPLQWRTLILRWLHSCEYTTNGCLWTGGDCIGRHASSLDAKEAATLSEEKISTIDALNCVQCCRKYQEKDNTGMCSIAITVHRLWYWVVAYSCIYHPGELMFVAEHKYVLSCCQVPVKKRQQAKKAPGCTKGRHCNSHHTQFTYLNYFVHMDGLVRSVTVSNCECCWHIQSVDAQELWLTVDPLTQCCEWGEVGRSNCNTTISQVIYTSGWTV